MVKLEAGQGVLDGGHSYTLIIQEQDEGNLPENQFVKFEIVTGAPLAWIAEMAGGLNTSVQVQNMSLDNLEGRFNWLKKVLAGQPYEKQIAWRENEDNEFDARDLISLLTCFNTELFPNDVSDTQPVVAYEKKSAALKLYENNQPSYERMAPIVNDILRLHDTIRSDAHSHWNDEGGAFGKLAFVETRKKGFYLPFDGKTVEYRLMSGAVYPILAAFRWMVDTDPKSKRSRWRGGFCVSQSSVAGFGRRAFENDETGQR